MSELIDAEKKLLAIEAREFLKGSRLYGEPIDPENLEDVLAAFAACHYSLMLKDEAYRSLSKIMEMRSTIHA